MLKNPFLFFVIMLFVAACSKSDLKEKPLESLEKSKLLDGSSQSTSDRYIVKFKESLLPKSVLFNKLSWEESQARVKNVIHPLLTELGIDPKKVVHTYSSVYPGIALPLEEPELNLLLKHPLVEIISPDEVITIDSFEEKENPLDFSKAQNIPWGVQRVGSADGTGKTAWVIDTGVDLDHPDLNVDALRSQSFATGDGTFLANGGDDNHGHGTHVAGTIGALDNNQGVLGVAAGATIVSVKVLGGNGSGLISDVIAGVDYAAALSLPGDVANMSLGGPANTLIDLAVQSAALSGTWYILAAGNDRIDANMASPARVNGPFIATVSAFRSGDRWAGFSNFGNPPIDYSGPGQGIYSTFVNGGYRTLNGTSMAAPHIAGIYLIKNGAPNVGGFVSNDPDGNPDPIGVL
ncbi:MAG: S8 family serine peptidase [Luteibaculum sp.]